MRSKRAVGLTISSKEEGGGEELWRDGTVNYYVGVKNKHIDTRGIVYLITTIRHTKWHQSPKSTRQRVRAKVRTNCTRAGSWEQQHHKRGAKDMAIRINSYTQIIPINATAESRSVRYTPMPKSYVRP